MPFKLTKKIRQIGAVLGVLLLMGGSYRAGWARKLTEAQTWAVAVALYRMGFNAGTEQVLVEGTPLSPSDDETGNVGSFEKESLTQ